MTTLNLTGYHLSFDDEFNSFLPTQLGGSTWNVTVFSGSAMWGSQNYTSGDDGGLNAYLAAGGVNPFSLGNGVLSITATPNTPGTQWDYTTGLIDNRYTFSQTYGYFEMRAQFPQGAGLWPGFWMMPTVDVNDGVPEIDIVEAFGSKYGQEGGANQIHYDLHSGTNENTRGTWATVNANIWTSYNTYGVLWSPTSLTFYFNGQSVGSLATSADLVGNAGASYMIGSLLTGWPGDWPGPMAGETGTLKIDYMRAFSSDTAIPTVALQTISAPDGGGTNLYGATTLGGSTTPPVVTPPVVTPPVTPPPPAPKPTVTITSGRSTPLTVNLVGSVTAANDKFGITSSGAVSAVLGRGTQQLAFHNTAGVTVVGGSGLDTISVDGGINSFTAGSGGMTVTSAAGTNTFNFLKNAGLLTINNFGASDTLIAPLALSGHITETSVHGGSMLRITSFRYATNAVYLPNVSNFNLSAIKYQ